MTIKRVARGSNPVQMRHDGMSVCEEVCRQCSKLLQRLHQSVPFPASAMDVTLALLPSNVPAYKDDGAVNANLRLSLLWGDVVHVAIEDKDDWQRMLKGELPFNRVFWMKLPYEVPVPDAITHPYRLFEAHPHYDALVEWHREASELDKRIDTALEQIGSVAKHAENGAILRALWPELLSFVNVHAAITHVPRELVKRSRYETRDVLENAERRSKIIELLTAATLLDADVKINAWVAFKTI